MEPERQLANAMKTPQLQRSRFIRAGNALPPANQVHPKHKHAASCASALAPSFNSICATYHGGRVASDATSQD